MKKISISILLLSSVLSFAKFKLSPLFSEDMILQRDVPINIWGTANPGEEITIKFKDKKTSAITLADSTWKINIGTYPAGGPFDMLIQSVENQQYFENISIGDVWLCGGQSNMEFSLKSLGVFDSIIQNANNKNLRLINISRKSAPSPQKEALVDGSWITVSPENTGKFSATAYFFGNEISNSQKVPVGLVSSNWGGSPAEVWMDEKALKSSPEIALEYRKSDSLNAQEKINQETRKKMLPEWVKKAVFLDSLSIAYEGKIENIPYSDWKQSVLPLNFNNIELPDFDGVMWIVKEIDIPQSFITENIKINLGLIDDADHTFLNGIKIGGKFNPSDDRIYEVPKSLIKTGKNILTIRMVDYGWGGAITSGNKKLCIENNLGDKISLDGLIYYKKGYDITKIEGYVHPNWSYIAGWAPSKLYNAMIHPLKNLPIKGVIWYQGEANAERAYQYRKLFPDLIKNWREAFNQPNLPFLFVQLANFMASESVPKNSAWAELREAQTFALKLSNTGMAVTIDVGDAADIHPKDKKTVGDRLAAQAKKIVYGDNNIASGPTFVSQKIEGNKIRINFKDTGKGIVFKGDMPHEFAIAGPDKKFYYANAKIEGNSILIWSKKVTKPVAVRYAWANNPSRANMYNENGFPMVPFRTDDWRGITSGVIKID
ncbi:MAG: sialate O-acetylesterase [Bacteroidetes bacterium]|nr:MAG: sialate O-acetylesterase [Bacteroidota bacterium]